MSVDFIYHLPLYALTLTTILAALSPPQQPQKKAATAGILTLLTCLVIMPFIRPISTYDSDGYIVAAPPQKLTKLLAWSPANSLIMRRLAAQCANRATPARLAAAEEFLTRAAECNPTDFNIRIALGKVRLKRGDRKGAAAAFKDAKAIRSWAPTPQIK